MNINDYVYLYVFDLEKSLSNMKKLREDRFGIIINKSILSNNNGNDAVLYDIRLFDGKVVQYRTDNLATNIVSIEQLKHMIDNMNISYDKKEMLNNQINFIINK